MKHSIKALTLATGITVLVSACAETSTAPNGADAARSRIGNSAVKFWDVGASASWNELATDLTTRRVTNASRLYAYLSLAQSRGRAGRGGDSTASAYLFSDRGCVRGRPELLLPGRRR